MDCVKGLSWRGKDLATLNISKLLWQLQKMPLGAPLDLRCSTLFSLWKWSVFAMAKIHRIGHAHQAPFFMLLGLGLDFKRWHKAKTSCHMINIPRTPNIFTDSGTPIKWLIWGLIRGAPDPPNPPYRGGPKYVLGGYDWWTILTLIESNILKKLLTSNIIWVICGESPDPPTSYPPRHL